MECIDNIKKTWQDILLIYKSKQNETIYDIVNTIISKSNWYKDQELDMNIFPKSENIFKAFKYFELDETKIVILGQDPYHSPNQATGLSFGVNPKLCKSIPPSLKNIVKELKNDLNIELEDYTLENWAKQGVLLLNASLTVIQGKPASQMKLWSDFTSYIIDELNKCEQQIIFVAWGAFAHNKLINIDTNKHKLIISSHPSPLSVYKNYKDYPCFNGSKPFSKINDCLKQNNKSIINW